MYLLFITFIGLPSLCQEREKQKWDALNKKIEQENERKKKLEEERRKKQEELKKYGSPMCVCLKSLSSLTRYLFIY